MRKRRHKGMMLMIAIVVIGLVAGLLALLTTTMAHRYRERQALRVRLVSDDIVHSAAVYAQAHKTAWTHTSPDKPIELSVKELLPARFSGNAVLTVVTSDGHRICRVTADTAWGAYSSHREVDIPLDGL